MPDYKELYLEMMRASERAIRELVRVQQFCEEMILQEADAEVVLEEKEGQA